MTQRVFEIFKSLSQVPRGSENMNAIADYCVAFAKEHSLKYIRDNADNIIIYKDASIGNEDKAPVILQGHLDMVCQKTADSTHNFLKDGIEVIEDGDFLKANNTTLGADNGIAVAMIMAILENNTISHPPIEAVFTTDEEIGMIGATQLDTSPLRSKRMINLDSEDDDTVTVSCAGGSEFMFRLPIDLEAFEGTEISIEIKGLKGGHSGVEIDKGRVNANKICARLLNTLSLKTDFRIKNINGGDKGNAITPRNDVIIVANNSGEALNSLNECLQEIKTEISAREPDFCFEIKIGEEGEYDCFKKDLCERLIFLLLNSPNGIMEMSAEIKGLVETSLNLGILKTEIDCVKVIFALRSNKKTALRFLEGQLISFAKQMGAEFDTYGHYPPWEYKPNSDLQKIYTDCFYEHYGFEPKIEAIHAGLECAVFDNKIDDLSSIAVGPQMYDVHTVNEKLSISSTEKFFALLIKVLSALN